METRRVSWDYKKAGVDIDKAEQALRLIRPYCEATHDQFVLGGIGPFAGALDFAGLMEKMGIRHPVLTFSTDGPGTITLVAKMVQKTHPERFADLGCSVVRHCRADMVCGGGTMVAYLDSIASTDLNLRVHEAIVRGMSEACLEAIPRIRIMGGETAQLPGIIVRGKTNFEGFAVGVVERELIINPHRCIEPGCVLVGVEAPGIMLNGLSLLRKITFTVLGMTATSMIPVTGRTVADEVLQRQPDYAQIVHELVSAGVYLCGISNITGGGLYDNIVRNLPEGCRVQIDATTWPRPALFTWLIEAGNVPLSKAYRTWNMGIGNVYVMRPTAEAAGVIKFVKNHFGLNAYVIGRVIDGQRGVEISF